MFVWRRDGELWITLQTDHMAQVADFGEAWGNAVCAAPRDRDAAVAAAALHDEGWREWEEHPGIDPATGLPLDFYQMPMEEHARLYGRGPDAAEQHSPLAGLLASLHASGLWLGRYGVDGETVPPRRGLPPPRREFVRREEERQRRLRRHVPAPETDIWHDYRLLEAWDRLGIFISHGHEEGELGPVPAARDPRGQVIELRRLDPLTIAAYPYPFAAPGAEFPVTVLRLPDRPFARPEELWEALAAAPREAVDFRVVAGRQ